MKLGERGPLLVWSAALALAGGACTQTVALGPPPPTGDGGGGSGGGDVSPTSGDAGVFAGCRRLTATPRIPDLVIALDRSMNMYDSFDPFPNRLAFVQQKLQDLAPYQALVHFGYEEFPVQSPSCSGDCCVGLEAYPVAGAFGTFLTAMKPCQNTPGSCGIFMNPPIAQGLAAIRQGYKAVENLDNHNRFVLLIAGDDPSMSCSSTPCGDAGGVTADMWNNWGVSTFVIAFASANDLSSINCLDSLPMPSRVSGYFEASTDDEFITALGNVMQQIAPGACIVDLKTMFPNQPNQIDPTKIEVLLNGTQLAKKNDPDGWWDFQNQRNSTIRLHGQACQNLISDTMMGGAPTDLLQVVQVDQTCAAAR